MKGQGKDKQVDEKEDEEGGSMEEEDSDDGSVDGKDSGGHTLGDKVLLGFIFLVFISLFLGLGLSMGLANRGQLSTSAAGSFNSAATAPPSMGPPGEVLVFMSAADPSASPPENRPMGGGQAEDADVDDEDVVNDEVEDDEDVDNDEVEDDATAPSPISPRPTPQLSLRPTQKPTRAPTKGVNCARDKERAKKCGGDANKDNPTKCCPGYRCKANTRICEVDPG